MTTWNHKIAARLQFRYHPDADRVYIDAWTDTGWVSFDNLSPDDFTEVCKAWLAREPNTPIPLGVDED
jgi:hypothetical protein